ncbi:uncharacterized protein MELLADRAFT_102060 [Melampsora larici-populina 98AG31]|uniref:Uncharacterized protein n=1 Tax=Melampsora larici-populina (strain 98AG31 / pathotype 3-4-7) TaxID=747676 RepID=F4R5V8_MELLP|nr:uncharacterized protein MELLADRAFT_102060 [Melampsora larici-populina 98AG31]EGG12185.1 hypothetical protein MELLADRAFT_102060 [Melampsora larici-populina 98AG31]
MYDFEMDENFKSPEDMNETAHINDAGDTIMEEDMIMDEPPLAGMDMTHHGLIFVFIKIRNKYPSLPPDSLIESGSSLEDVQAQKPSKSFTRYSHRQGPADSTEAYEQQPRNRRNEKRRASEMVPGGDVVWKLSAIDDTSSVLQLAAPTHQDIVNTHHQPTNHMHNTETNQPPEMLSQARQVPELKAPINTLSQGPSQLYENMNLGKVQDQSLNSDLDSVNGEASSKFSFYYLTISYCTPPVPDHTFCFLGPISESEGTIFAQPVTHANSSVHHNHLQTPSNPGLVHSEALNQHSTQQAESLQSFVDTRQHKPQDPPHFTGTPVLSLMCNFQYVGDRYPTPKDHDRSTSLRTMILSKAPPIPSGFHHSDSKNISSLSPTPVGSSNQLPQLFRSEDEIQLTSSTTPISHLKVPSRLFDTEGNRTISNRQSRQVFRPTISERREPFLGTSRSSYPAAPAPIDLSCPRSSREASYHQTTPAEPPLSSHKSSERRTPIAGPSRGPFPPAPLTMDHSSMMDISPSSVLEYRLY